MRKASILSGYFITGFGLKMRAKPRKTNKVTIVPRHFHMLGAHGICLRRICLVSYARGAYFMPYAHSSTIPCPRHMLLCFKARFLRSSSFFGFRLQITCLETWKQDSFLFKVSWDLLNLHFCLPNVLTIL